MNPAQYAEHVGVTERTVQRWLSGGELPDARKAPDGRWHIPADAMRIQPLVPVAAAKAVNGYDTSSDVSPTRRGDVGASGQPVSLAQVLERLPALLSLEEASRVLGIPESQIRRYAGQLEALPWGKHGSLVVPARVVRELAGLI